ncbi:MAG: hypothetical protein HN341_01230 [Verrucomicrobia bacterium]|nr:hypothetical protein [Verrucomicrobiota bacterium]
MPGLECGDRIAAFCERGEREFIKSDRSDLRFFSTLRFARIQSGDFVTALHNSQAAALITTEPAIPHPIFSDSHRGDGNVVLSESIMATL